MIILVGKWNLRNNQFISKLKLGKLNVKEHQNSVIDIVKKITSLSQGNQSFAGMFICSMNMNCSKEVRV